MQALLEALNGSPLLGGGLAALGMGALRGAVLLGAAGLVNGMLRRAPAASRHRVWSAAVAGLLALAPLGLLLPAWRVELLPEARQLVGECVTAEGLAPLAVLPTPAPAPMLAAGSGAGAARWVWGLGLAWAAGAALVAGRTLLGLRRLRRMEALAEPIEGEDWLELLDRCCARLRLRRPVRLLLGEGAGVPMTWGWRRPVVLLPREALEWGEERRRLVLLHELAHVRRGDWLTQMLARAAGCVYWFHPLVWHASSRMLAERERACDELVLAGGGKASDYAEHLLDIARGWTCSAGVSSASMAMARRSELEGRLLALLDPRRGGWGAHPAVARAALLCVLGLAPCLAMLRPAQAEAPVFAVIGAGTPEADAPPAEAEAPVLAGAPGSFTIEQIIQLKRNGVDPEYVRGMKEAGFQHLSAEELVQLSRHGVCPAYARALAEAGCSNLNTEQICALARNGVDARLIRKMRELGYENLNVEQLIELARNGVDAEFVEGLMNSGLEKERDSQ